MELKLSVIIVLGVIGLSTAAKLSNNYLPPNSAASAGGYAGFLQSPQHVPRPTNQYIPPQSKQNLHYHGVSPGKSQHHRQQQALPQHASYSNFRQPAAHGSPIAILRSENVNNGDGTYNFAFETANGIRRQEDGHLRNANSAHPEQVVKGSYSYTGDDGKQYTVHYTADSGGFQVQGDHLPTPPPVPYEIQKSLAVHHKTAQLNQQYSASPSSLAASAHVRAPTSQYLPPNQAGYSYNQPGGRKYK